MKKYFRFFVIFLVLSCWIPHIASAQVVDIPDDNLEAVLRKLFEGNNVLGPNQPITRLHMELIIRLDLSGQNIKDLTGLEFAKNIERLNIMLNHISNLSPLTGLAQLNELWLGLNPIKDLSPVAGLKQLEELYIPITWIADLSPLSGLTLLKILDVPDNKISDLNPLARLIQLEELNLRNNQISDLSPLTRLTKLKSLKLADNRIQNVSPLARLVNLETLSLARNPIQDTSPLANLRKLTSVDVEITAQTTRPRTTVQKPDPPGRTIRIPDLNLAAVVREALGLAPNARITQQTMRRLTSVDAYNRQIKNLTGLEHATELESLSLGGNDIRDVRPLAELTQLETLNLGGNDIRDVRPLAGLTQLRWLNLGGNDIRDVRPLAGLTQLKWLSLTNNQISDVSPIAVLTRLEWLYLSDNQIQDVRPLAGLTQLKGLFLQRNDIRDVSALVKLVNLKETRLRGNPIQDTSPLARLPKETKVDIKISQKPVDEIDFTLAGPKIEGPWAWTIVSTGRIGGEAAAASGIDYLARASKGSMTEKQIAINGAVAGNTIIRNKRWTLGKLSPTGVNNITEMLNAIGLGGNRNNHVAYGSISLNTERKQNTTMYVGSDDAVKVWLNGVLVHDNPIDRGASDYQDAFPVTLKNGKNIILVAVYERTVDWSGFFGFKRGTAYSPLTTPTVKIGLAQRPPMYWIDAKTGTLQRLIGTEVENFLPQVQNATSLTVDATNNKIYWIEQMGRNRGNVKRANLDGSNVQTLATVNSVPNSIAVDTTRGMLYWTNSRGRIQRSNLNGKQIRNLVLNLDSPDNITVDVAGAKLYWTEASGRIRRSNLNGKSIQNIASGLGSIDGIAIHGNMIYYGSTLTGESRRILGRTNLNGSNLRTIILLGGVLSGITVDPVGKKIYWTETHGNMWRSNLNGRNIKEVVSGLTSPARLVLGSSSAATAAAAANSLLTSSEIPTPDATDLLANYPNPFNPETWIPYQLAKPANVTLTIYAVNGEMVRQLVLGHQAAGVYQSKSRAAYWDGRNALGEPVASGVYFYTFTAGNFTATRKMLIRK